MGAIVSRMSIRTVFQFLMVGAIVSGGGAIGRGGDATCSETLLDRSAVLAAAAEVTLEVYSNAHAVLVDNGMRVRYEPDGRSSTLDDQYLKVLTEQGRESYASLTFSYTLPYDTVTVLCVERIGPDGTTEAVDLAAQSGVMSDPSQMGMNIYNPNRRLLRVNVPRLEPGDVLHIVDRRDVVKPRVPGAWADYNTFEATVPIRGLTYEVEAPDALPIARMALRDVVTGTVVYTASTDTGGVTRHVWKVEDVPRMYPEPNMPPAYTCVQRLLLSTVSNWPALSRWYWTLSLPHLEAITPAMSNRVAELLAGVDDERTRIERIFQWVARNVRYMGLTLETEAPGYEPHDVSLTFENRYGVCRDKAALLVAMLRLAGVDAFPVLIDTGALKDEEVPQPYFNHAIVAVRRPDGGYDLLDPTDENSRAWLPAYLGHKSYLVATPEGETLRVSPFDPASNNLARIETEGSVDEAGVLRARTRIAFDGINDGVYRGYFARVKPEDRVRFFESRIKRDLPQAVVEAVALKPEDLGNREVPLEVDLVWHVDAWPIGGAGQVLIHPPWLGASFGVLNALLRDTGLETRRYPLFTEMACGVSESFTMALPEGMEGGRGWSRTNDADGVRFEQTVEVRDGVWSGRSEMALDAVRFDPAAYADLKDVLRAREAARRLAVVARDRRGRSRDPDVRVERQVIDVDVGEGGRWIEDRSVRLKVLTYAGKKDVAEVRVAYTPGQERIQWLEARTIAPDGVVREAVSNEFNEMDADWVGEAPRYTPRKTVVLSLPAVQEGGWVEYRLRRTVRNAPFFDLTHAFRGRNPIDEGLLTVTSSIPLRVVTLDADDALRFSASTNAEGRMVYAWRSGAREGLVLENRQPPLWSFTPSALLSAGGWATYGAALREACERAATDQTQAILRAQALAAEHTDRRSLLRALRDDVARNIRLAGPALADQPLDEVTPADRTLAEGYGSALDRAVLLHALLGGAGFDPEWVLASDRAVTASPMDEALDVPQRDLFKTMLVRVVLGDDTIYLNDTDQYARLGSTPHDGRWGLMLNGALFAIEAAADARDRVDTAYRIEIAPDGGASMRRTRSFFGMPYAERRGTYARMSPEERRLHDQALVSEIAQDAHAVKPPDARFDAYPGVEEIFVHVPRWAVLSGRRMYFELPTVFEQALGRLADRRQTPLWWDQPYHRTAAYHIEWPARDGRLALAPPDVKWSGPSGIGSIVMQTIPVPDSVDRAIVDVVQRVDLRPAWILPDDYGALLDAHRLLARPRARTIMGEAPSGPAGTNGLKP